MVFIASGDCPWLDHVGLKEAIHAVRQHYRTAAESQGGTFVTIGISVDVRAEDGIRMLRRFGPFDEMVAGRGWLNTGTMRYTWAGVSGPPSEPQVVIVDRNVEAGRDIAVTDEQQRVRRSGVYAILDWAAALESVPPVPGPGP